VLERLRDRDVGQLGPRAPAERPARGGDDEPLERARGLAREQVVHGGVLGVDRQQGGSGRLGERHDELAPDDERLLVGQREVHALGQGDDRGPEAGGADDRVEDEVGARLGDEAHEALGAGEHLAVRPRLRGARGGVGVADRDPAHAVGPRLFDEGRPGGLGRQPHELELLRRAGDDVERLGPDRPRRAQYEQPLHACPW
jgi:hypothetical protein